MRINRRPYDVMLEAFSSFFKIRLSGKNKWIGFCGSGFPSGA